MSYRYHVSSTIAAPAENVWAPLTTRPDTAAKAHRAKWADGVLDDREFPGRMARLITKAIPDVTESFDQFADCLKGAAERDD
jgi:hypothetical protein